MWLFKHMREKHDIFTLLLHREALLKVFSQGFPREFYNFTVGLGTLSI